MDKKRKTSYFKKLYLGKNNKVNIAKRLNDIHNKFANKEYNSIPELPEKKHHLRIYLSAIQRSNQYTNGDYNIYGLNIACIDMDQKVEYGDLSESVPDRAKTPKEVSKDTNGDKLGALSNTRLVIDPYRNIVEVSIGMNQLSQINVKRFLKKLLGTKAMQFNVIFDKKAIKDVANMKYIDKFQYNIASPTNFATFKNNKTTEKNDLRLANYFSSPQFSINFKIDNMSNTSKIVNKVKSLLTSSNHGDEVKTVKIGGIGNDGNEQIDLIRNELRYVGYIKFSGRIINEDYFNFLLFGYQKRYPFIKEIFKIENEPEES